MILRLRDRSLDLAGPVLMGIVNATPTRSPIVRAPRRSTSWPRTPWRRSRPARRSSTWAAGRTDTQAIPAGDEAARVVPLVERLAAARIASRWTPCGPWPGGARRGSPDDQRRSGLSDESVAQACAASGAALVITHTRVPQDQGLSAL